MGQTRVLLTALDGQVSLTSTRLQVHNTGFFSVTGTGLTDEEVQRQYDIGQAFFAIPHEEKSRPQYKCDFANGNYFGYRELAEKTIKGTEVRDNVESYNHAKFTEHYKDEPRHPFFAPYMPEIQEFSRVGAHVYSLQHFASPH